MLHLGKLTQLSELDLTYCGIDEATAGELLSSLSGLRSLVLVQDSEDEHPQPCPLLMPYAIDGIVLVIESNLKGLRELYLDLPGVQDANVGLLEGLTQLSQLYVKGLSGHIVDRLRQVLVGCSVKTNVCIGFR
jgi:hypothetical protein